MKYKCMDDLRQVDCEVLTIGQYLQPTRKHLEVVEYLHPDQFAYFKERGWPVDLGSWRVLLLFDLLIMLKNI